MIRRTNENDTSRTAEIHVYGWRNAYKGLISDKELFNHRSVEKSMNGHRRILHNSEENFDIYDDGIIKGFIIHQNSRDKDMSKSYEICAVYVEPAFLRNGIGKKLIDHAECTCRELHKENIILWVLEKNKIGRSFYEKNGYSFDGAEKIINSWNLKELRYSKQIS